MTNIEVAPEKITGKQVLIAQMLDCRVIRAQKNTHFLKHKNALETAISAMQNLQCHDFLVAFCYSYNNSLCSLGRKIYAKPLSINQGQFKSPSRKIKKKNESN